MQVGSYEFSHKRNMVSGYFQHHHRILVNFFNLKIKETLGSKTGACIKYIGIVERIGGRAVDRQEYCQLGQTGNASRQVNTHWLKLDQRIKRPFSSQVIFKAEKFNLIAIQ